MNKRLQIAAISNLFKISLSSLLIFCLLTVSAFAQSTVSGTVTENNLAIPGVNVVIKGTTAGTITDATGAYQLEVPADGSILVFSYVGFATQEVTVGNRSVINQEMRSQVEGLPDVVTAAFGLERDKRALSYAVQNVETSEITEARPLNIAEGLSGKVAGISVTRTGGGVGADTKVTLRGNRSIAGSSEPLYILDGVPLGGDIDNLSPDDIASITVLKGANAAALYGNRANNGAIIVTTKTGKKDGKDFNVELNTSFMAAQPIHLINFQNEYGQGSSGMYHPQSTRSWGPSLNGSQVAHWSNDPNFPSSTTSYSANPDNKTRDFFQTGHNFATNLGVSSQGANTNSYVSYTHTDADGIIPNNQLTSHNLNTRVISTFWNKLTLDVKANIIRTEIDNRPETGDSFLNPVRGIFSMPTNIKTADAQQFEFVDNSGLVKQHFWAPSTLDPGNPYWTVNRVQNDILNDRVIGLISLDYDITNELNIRVSSSIDRFNQSRRDRLYTDTYTLEDEGRYMIEEGNGLEWNSDFFLNYNKEINSDWSIKATVGGNIRKNEFRETALGQDRDSQLNVPNLFSIGNMAIITADEEFRKKEVQSLFGFATIGWKNGIFLDITGRNDWSSTLPKENWSVFYPSVGLAAVVSDLVTLPETWSLLKLRGSYAIAGNDTHPYLLSRGGSFSEGGNRGFMQLSDSIPNQNLMPEETRSIELGIDIQLLANRLGIDLTWYKSNSINQLFTMNLPVASGASQIFINGADIQNKGVEITLNATPVQTKDFSWNFFINYASNTSEVIELARGIDELGIGKQGFMGQFKLVVGQPWGEVYSRGFNRTGPNGPVIVETDGTPRTTPGHDVKVANFNPDWLGGFQNYFTYKNFTLSFLIDIRKGGTMVSATKLLLSSRGQTEATLDGREGGLIFGRNFYAHESAVQPNGSANNVATTAEHMWRKLGSCCAPVGEAFVLDASNTRLRELIFGYNLPLEALANTPFTQVKISLVGRNLFFLSNAAGSADSEVLTNTATNADGLESFGPPTSRELGLNLKFSF